MVLVFLTGMAIYHTEGIAICLQGDCYDGKGTYQFDDEGIYKGEWKNGKMHGAGRFSFEGDWIEGVWDSARLVKITRQKARAVNIPIKKADNNPYRCIHGDCEDGYGTFQYETGQYVGYWQNQKRHGSGDFYWNEGDHYSGEWREDGMSGHGFLESRNGDKFSGKWLNNKKQGEGTLWKADGKIIKGEWEDGKLLLSTASSSQPGASKEVSNRDLLNYVFYSNQSINKSIYRLKNRLSLNQSVGQDKESKKNRVPSHRISDCIEAKEEILRIREAIEGRQALEKKVSSGTDVLMLPESQKEDSAESSGYYLDKIYTLQDLVEVQSKAESACAGIEGQ